MISFEMYEYKRTMILRMRIYCVGRRSNDVFHNSTECVIQNQRKSEMAGISAANESMSRQQLDVFTFTHDVV